MDPQLQTPPPQPPQSPPSVSSENSSRSFWKTLGIGMSIVSFGIALAVGGYFLGANKNKTAEAPTSQITSTPTPTVDPTVNWKTYTNTNYGFSFKYPDSWPLLKAKSLANNELEGIYFSPNITSTSADNTIAVIEIFKNLDIKSFAPQYNTDIKETVINGYKALSLTRTSGMPQLPIYEYIIINDDYYYDFRLLDSFETNKNRQVNINIFNQILSTFKFTDSSANVGMGCKIGGCSGQICQNETDEGAITTCEYKEEYACYKTAKCEVQANGKCGWTPTEELSSCLNSN